MAFRMLKLCRFIHLESRLQAARNKPNVAVSPDQTAYICWHPEPEFPYEHTRPVPRNVGQLEESDSVLKVQHLQATRNIHATGGPSNRELKEMFFTTKHKWHPKPRRRFAKTDTGRDREGV
ncbi:hypothetical protein LSH36_216g06071 [Paralvinella palmiformis]|uniref:Large ribosomal subunit protein mL42 n=1 Tax=Paralvinella palmiformis TaxID=53620 RepID=A0AAD9JN90_9ANNE|nr:hypothetical protein LSH36_216g06071 [Paralvinella palmiformis]